MYWPVYWRALQDKDLDECLGLVPAHVATSPSVAKEHVPRGECHVAAVFSKFRHRIAGSNKRATDHGLRLECIRAVRNL
jgi:hypothetical protein